MKSTTSKQQKSKTPSQASHPSLPVIFICGESPLVEEFAQRCTAHGYAVHIRWNTADETRHPSLPPSIVINTSIPKETVLACELTNIDREQKKKNIQELGRSLSPTTPILTSSVTVTATEQASWIGRRHRLVGLGALPSLLSKPLLEIAPTVHTLKETVLAISNFIGTIGGAIEVVEDRVGLILPRLLCSFINQMYFALEENIAPPDDIDRAINLGTAFSKGPLAWAEELTFPQIEATLRSLQDETSLPHYTVAPLIHHLASTGVWWKNQKEMKTT